MSGEKVCKMAWSLMAVWMDWRFAEVKISGLLRLVMRRVLEGGVGCCRGGRSERSSDMFGECRFDGVGGEWADEGGVETSIAIVAMG